MEVDDAVGKSGGLPRVLILKVLHVKCRRKESGPVLLHANDPVGSPEGQLLHFIAARKCPCDLLLLVDQFEEKVRTASGQTLERLRGVVKVKYHLGGAAEGRDHVRNPAENRLAYGTAVPEVPLQGRDEFEVLAAPQVAAREIQLIQVRIFESPFQGPDRFVADLHA